MPVPEESVRNIKEKLERLKERAKYVRDDGVQNSTDVVYTYFEEHVVDSNSLNPDAWYNWYYDDIRELDDASYAVLSRLLVPLSPSNPSAPTR